MVDDLSFLHIWPPQMGAGHLVALVEPSADWLNQPIVASERREGDACSIGFCRSLLRAYIPPKFGVMSQNEGEKLNGL